MSTLSVAATVQIRLSKAPWDGLAFQNATKRVQAKWQNTQAHTQISEVVGKRFLNGL